MSAEAGYIFKELYGLFAIGSVLYTIVCDILRKIRKVDDRISNLESSILKNDSKNKG